MYTIEQFIIANDLRPADAVVMTKKFFGMLDHYVIYLGKNHRKNQHEFVANYTEGIQVIPPEQLDNFLQTLQPKEIEKFPGNEFQRVNALERAKSRIGEKAYQLFSNNCEHFKNWVHHGIPISKQVEVAGKSFAVVGTAAALIGLAKNNKALVILAVILIIIGAIALAAVQKNEEQQKFSEGGS